MGADSVQLGLGSRHAKDAYFPLLHSMRGVAALWVFVLHIAFYLGLGTGLGVANYLAQHVSNYPAPSVVVFFALSGFVLYRPYALARYEGRTHGSLSEYAYRRAARVLPAYWTVLVITALVFGHGYVFTATGLLRYFGFAQVYDGRTFSQGVPPAWSLDVDVAFYACLPLVVWLMHRRPIHSRRAFLTSELGMCAAIYAGSMVWQALVAHLSGSETRWLFPGELSLPGSVDIMACGMALAAISVALWDRPEGGARRAIGRFPWLPWVFAGAAYVLIGYVPRILGHNHAVLVWLVAKQLRCVLAIAILVPLIFGLSGGGTLRRWLSGRFALYLGTISYAFYLWHWAVIAELSRIGARGALGAPLFVALALALTLLVASVSWYGLERPLQALVRRWLARRHEQRDASMPLLDPADAVGVAVNADA